MVFVELLDPVFRPLLGLDPLFAVGLVAFIVSLLITVIYRFTTNQDLMKRLKDELKSHQKEMKELKEHPERMMQVQKQAMQTNMKYMMQSMKSTLYTFLPIILIFAWMNANFAFDAISPQEQFSITLQFEKDAAGDVFVSVPEGMILVGSESETIVNREATFNFKGDTGDYIEGNAIKFTYDDRDMFKDVIITSGTDYTDKDLDPKDPAVKRISINYDKKEILPVLNWGWLGTYIIFSVVFSMLLRRLMKVY